MSRFDRIYNEIKNPRKMIDQILIEIFRENEVEILELNSIDQLYDKGVNSEGVSISSYQDYRPLTIRLKKLKGQPTNRVTLNDTGSFYQKFTLDIMNRVIFFDSKDEKAEDLVLKYGEDIFGLTPDNIVYVQENIIRTNFVKKLKKYLDGIK